MRGELSSVHAAGLTDTVRDNKHDEAEGQKTDNYHTQPLLLYVARFLPKRWLLPKSSSCRR